MAQFPQCLCFDLPDPFTRDCKLLPDLFEGVFFHATHAESELQYLLLALGQSLENIYSLIFQQGFDNLLRRGGDVLILDEPELGLHPYAITVVGGLIRSVSSRAQVIVATQSMPLLDCFEPNNVVVVEREGRQSNFHRLETKALEEWLRDYSLSELWEKNVFGGRPA